MYVVMVAVICLCHFSNFPVAFRHLHVLWLLLNYHRHLRKTSVELELYVEGGRVSHSWCMCVIGHGYGGFGGAGMEVVGGMHAGQCRGSHFG